MTGNISRGFGSPGKYIQGQNELNNLYKYTDLYGKNVSVIIDGFLFNDIKALLGKIYQDDSNVNYVKFSGECSVREINRFKLESEKFKSNVIVGIGGGKTLDTAKAVSGELSIPVIIVPTAASTDAPTSALTVIYTDEGIHSDFICHKKNPDIVLVDTAIICRAPVRLLVSGMGDALATYFEALANEASDTENYVGEGYRRTMLGMMIAKLCYETLIEKGLHAKIAAENGCCTEAFEDVVEANILLSGLGFENTGCAGAHGIHTGLTELPEANSYFHGEKVAFGTICQLVLENKSPELIDEVMGFCTSVGLPVTLGEMGIEDNDDTIRIIAKHSVKEILSEPFTITEESVFNSIKTANGLGKIYSNKCH
ncbi:glycerol dehydrogenase [Dethiosulfatibacter aminovorans DSM 17477]|uniref:Glycerol dehydrogenase n=1 Tax=Dethiosulfatibacter aminovorans DSM 17477 TaxID=1121476 RepID=A0A1M6IYU3_9FIRM|nr:glycerol dehydrogenase [Dethiosulfatibacter aminovorans]SHJ39616.1 glycerol dehydrogenase [Dethiosulfatibacter aminovorans DSM 17477]